MSVSQLIQDMVEEGVSAEIIGRTVELLVTKSNEKVTEQTTPLTNAERQAKHREKQRLAKQDVTKSNESNVTPVTKEKRTKKENAPPSKENPPTGVKRKVSPRGSRITADWTLPIDWGDWANEQGMPVDDILIEEEKFRDYWLGVGGQKGVKADWQATWRNWVRRAMEFKNGN